MGPVAERNGIICSLVSADGARSMAADRGAAPDLRPDELEPGWLADCDHLFVSGYALLREPARSAALRAADLARGNGAAVSVDLASWSAVRDAGPGQRCAPAVEALAPDVLFANEDEERILGGMLPDATWILKRGAAGAWFDGDERAALPAEVVDTTGAGDALAAGWIVGGPDLALEAAARCVAKLGAMP